MTTAADVLQWEGRTVAEWRSALDLPALHVHDSIPSTSDVARDLAQQGAAAGTVVMAEHQTQGRGRQGRPWTAPAGSSLMLSVVLRPEPTHDAMPGTLPLRVGLAVARAIRTTGVDARVKWPNDVVVPEHGKIAGVLCEAVALGGTGGFVIASVGINVHQQDDDWPEALRDVATSIDACSRQRTDRGKLLAAVIDELRPLFHASVTAFGDDALEHFASLDALAGRDILVHGADGLLRGIADGIDRDGALRVHTTDGIRRVTSGTVRTTLSPEHSRA